MDTRNVNQIPLMDYLLKCDAQLFEVVQWDKYRYIVVGDIRLKPEPQQLSVIDITGRSDIAFVKDGFRLGREFEKGDKAIVINYHGEGHQSLCLFDDAGNLQRGEWVTWAELPIQVVPTDKKTAERLRLQMWAEIADNVDAGGHLEL